jgi:hypothetical protein
LDDTFVGAWQTEAFSAAAEKQLKRLAELLSSAVPFDVRALSDLIGDGFDCGRFRPETPDVVFEDGSFQVLRRVSDSALLNGDRQEYGGPGGFADALAQLTVPLTDASDVHCKFKIFRVAVTQQGATTLVYFQRSGRTARGVVQQSAVWDCRWTLASPANPPRLVSISAADYEETLGKKIDGPLFADCTEAILGRDPSYREHLVHGLDYWLDRIELRYGILANGYQGLVVGDVNGDGLDDVYVCQPGGVLGGLPNRLLVQNPDGTATDTSASAGVDWLVQSHGALLADLDNDGDQDLVLATTVGLIFAANDGHGVFTTKVAKLVPEAPPISLSAADFDNDGDLDVYACCYSHRSSSELLGRPMPYHDANNGGRNVLFRNDRSWRWTNVTKRVGLDENNRRFSLAGAWEDYDNDGDLDLYVANDYGRNNLYRNDEGHFHDVAGELGVEDISAGMSVSWGDYNRDGWMDLYVSNMWSSAGNRVAYQRRFLGAHADDSTLLQYQRHARGNSLFSNSPERSSPGFHDVGLAAAVTMGRWAWSSSFADVNNDGWEDIVVANGFITQENADDL